MKIKFFFYKIIRKIYLIFFGNKYSIPNQIINSNFNKVSEIIINRTKNKKPFFVGRVGSYESSVISNYLALKLPFSIKNFLTGKSPPNWWDKSLLKRFNSNAGFFPINDGLVEKYSKLMINDLKYIDLIGVWSNKERFYSNFITHATQVNVEYLDPFFASIPWTKILKNKNVLVIHPFEKTILKQYKIKSKIFKNKEILPKFNIKTIKAPLLEEVENSKFKNWFDCLNDMKFKMDNLKYDIVLIGCGAYGFNLAAHAKRRGKIAIHLGGSLQILFGIKGKRYENPNQLGGRYIKLFNKHWTRPSKNERPKKSNRIENNAYW